MKAWMGRRLVWIGGIATLALVVGVVSVILYGYQANPEPGWVGVSDKKFWDYLELLIGPAVLAIGVAWLNWALRQREARREDLAAEAEANRQREAAEAEATQQERREREREAAEEARRERELEVENQRAQDAALQAYLDGMAQLLTDKERPLHRASVGDNLSTVARARTLTVLTRLDGDRKGSVVRFLYEAGLITKERFIVELNQSDLREADLRGANLGKAVLTEAGLTGARLNRANLSRAYLIGAYLSRAVLRGAYLFKADLTGADLTGADLTGANLTGAKGITNEELEQQAASLKDATMPNGQKYEDWLKSRGEDGENSGPS